MIIKGKIEVKQIFVHDDQEVYKVALNFRLTKEQYQQLINASTLLEVDVELSKKEKV